MLKLILPTMLALTAGASVAIQQVLNATLPYLRPRSGKVAGSGCAL